MWAHFAPGKTRRDDAPQPGDDGDNGEARDHLGAGLSILLASLAVLFAVAIFGYGAVRAESEQWGSIWTFAGAGLMAVASLALIFTQRVYRYAASYAAQERDVRPWLVSGVVGALVYGAAQATHWSLLEPGLGHGLRNEVVTFTLLTSLHAVLCVAGCVATGLMAWRYVIAGSGGCGRGLFLLYRYWTFLLWAWPVLLLVLVV
jgi:heme/copper-type cytochrome/quinol oxidase subunit 3